jgi:UDP-glucose:(heptosyl)LPS alpha-1,3-glucosyltransferase
MVSGLPVLTTDVCGYAYYVADEGMGVVDASPFDQSSFNKNLTSLLCEPRDIWFDKGRRFAETADIYDLSNHVAELLEGFMLQS